MSKTTNADIIQATKKNYKIECKYCKWHITYLHTTYWRMERQKEMFDSMNTVLGACPHDLKIIELS